MLNLIAFVPAEFYALLIAGAGLAFIVGARRLAGAAIVIVLAGIFLPVILAPLFDELPTWFLLALLVLLGLAMLRELFVFFLGRNATDHMVGILAADVVKKIVVVSFSMLGFVFKTLFRRAP